ncbi:SDR family NAD(P)-dependent oxidoreductase [Nonomuraea sp. KM88]|uniref:SDR family NAD(P)-dependent oxidoreductase n=1 Tax=Nonomuraea sp. KM88 TaxID=3457427 RepID=UPI003FCE1198
MVHRPIKWDKANEDRGYLVVESGPRPSAGIVPSTTPEHAVPAHDLAGHTVLVTGASGPGIGSGVCDALHAAGARLVINDLVDEHVERTVRRYPGAVGVAGDVSRPDDVARIFEEAIDRAGPLTGLVNNAGVGLIAPMLDATQAEFDRVVDIDFRGVWLMSQAFARSVVAHGRPGAIVNVSSVHADKTIGQYAIYASAKAAVEGLTRACAVEFGSIGVRCNAIAPGYVPINRDLVPPGYPAHDASWIAAHTGSEQVLQRTIEPIDCGWAVRFLLSEQSRCVTGQVITIDAGLTARLYNGEMSARIYADRKRQAALRAEGPDAR